MVLSSMLASEKKMHVGHITECLAHSKSSINVSCYDDNSKDNHSKKKIMSTMLKGQPSSPL